MAAAKDTVVTISEVARDALGFDTEGRVGTHDQRRIEATMTELGWERAKRGPNGERWWRPTAAWTTVGKPSGGSEGWA